MNAYQRVALNEYLSGYPRDNSYDEVLDKFLKGDDEVIVWEAFEHFPREVVVEFIDTLMDILYDVFIPRKEDEE